MHFNILTAVALPELENSLVPLEDTVERLVFETMDPYGMYTENPEHLVFCAYEEGEDGAYETGTMDCVRLPDGSIVCEFDRRFSGRYEIFEGKAYQKESGPLRHRKRTKRAKKFLPLPEYPLKKLYLTFQMYMEQYLGCFYNEKEQAYGYCENPCAFWDWLEVGGRWSDVFLVKDDCPYVLRGAQANHHGSDRPAPDGYCWVSGARKCDIAWDKMKEVLTEDAVQKFHQLQEWYRTGEVPEEQYGFVTVAPEGVYVFGRLVYQANETMEQNLRRSNPLLEARYAVKPYAFIGGKGWMECEYSDSGNEDEAVDMRWNQAVQELIDSLPEDVMLVSVDCHR